MATMALRKKQLNEELQVINKSMLGKVTIESAPLFSNLTQGNSREGLYTVIKTLYSFSKKLISQLDDLPPGKCESHITADEVNSLVKTQLTEVLPGLLKDVLENHSGFSSTNTTAKVVKDKEPNKIHTVVLEKLEDDWTTVVQKDVKQTLKSVPVLKARASDDGTAKLIFKSEADMSRAHEALKTKYTATKKTQEPKKLDPRLTILDLQPGISSKEELEKLIIEKNDTIRELHGKGETITVMFLDRNGGKFAVLRVSPKIRKAIRDEGDKLFVDLQRHHVRDRIHVVQCYHCQGYGHTSESPHCKQKDSAPTCFYCAGSHRSDKCKSDGEAPKARKCTNCAKSNNKLEKNKCTTHKASDNLCPFYIREKLRMMDRTPGCEESKNFYHQRVKEHQRRLGRI